MLQHDRSPFRRLDSSDIHIAAIIFSHKRLKEIILGRQLLRFRRHHEVFAFDRYEKLEFIAAVNIHRLRYRPQTMRRINISFSAAVMP